MTPKGSRHSGFVLSDGAARGAYEVGVMRAVISGASPSTQYRPIEPITYTGTSVGGFNAAVMGSQPGVRAAETVGYLDSVWRNRIADRLSSCGNGVLRIRGMPLQGFELGCLLRPLRSAIDTAVDGAVLSTEAVRTTMTFLSESGPPMSRALGSINASAFVSTAPFERLIRESIDFEGIQASGRHIAVATTNWDNGRARLFLTPELRGEVGPKAINATAAIPGIFAPVKIQGSSYVDGGLVLNTPLRAALRAGATDLHVVYLDPLVINSSLGSASTFDALLRSYSIMTAQRLRADIETARKINSALELMRNLKRGEAPHSHSGAFDHLTNLVDLIERENRGSKKKIITIHSYRPRTDLGDGADLLNFHLPNITTLIEQGEYDARHHDCRQEGCVTLGSPALASEPQWRRRSSNHPLRQESRRHDRHEKRLSL